MAPDHYTTIQNIAQVQVARARADAIRGAARRVAYQGRETEMRWLKSAKADYAEAFEKLKVTGMWPDGHILQEYFCARDFLELQTMLLLVERNPYCDS